MNKYCLGIAISFVLLTYFFIDLKLVSASTISYIITSGIPTKTISGGSVFFTTEFKLNYQGGKIWISSNPDGTGNTQVNDVLNIAVIRANGTTAFFGHFYPDGFCSSLNILVPSLLTFLFLPGENNVKVTLNNACGNTVGSSPLYLVNSEAPTPTPTPTPSPSPTPIPTKTPLILIPGIGGSELKVSEDTSWSKDDGHGGIFNHIYSKDEKIWVNEAEAANPGNDDYFDILRMRSDGITSEANITLTGNLYPGAYQEAINFFINDGYTLNKDLFVFPYDWRKDLSSTTQLLDQTIQQIKQQTNSQKIDIVAHSMGGLVARNYIADSTKAQNIRKLFELGVPHLGATEFLKDLRYGGCLKYQVGPFCLTLAPAEMKDVLQNMITGFQLAPAQFYFNFYTNQDHQHPYPYINNGDSLNYLQIKYLLNGLGYNTLLFTPSEIFHNLDNSLNNTNGVDVTVIAGSGISTVGQIIEKTTNNLDGSKTMHKDQMNINGDDTVPLFSASLNDPSANLSLLGNAKVFYVKQKHGALVSNGPTLNLVKNILNGDDNLPEGASLQPYKFKGHGLSVHSPVNINIYDSNGNHTGLTESGFETNIPGSSYDTLDDAKFIFLPDDGIYNIKFEATDQGSFDFKIRNYDNDENTKTILYKNIPITATSQGETIYDTNSSIPPNLIIDQQTINPTAILEGDANYDQIPPQILANTPIDNGIYLLNQNVYADYLCSDENSGVDFCTGSKLNGDSLETSSVGIKTFNINASDKAGNISSKNVNYKIQYVNSGTCLNNPGHIILQPVNLDGSSVFKQGSTIPIKFRVCDYNGNSINTPNLVIGFNLIKTLTGTTAMTVNEPAISTTPESAFRWDSTNQLWIFNMNTKNLSSGKTYFYRIGLNDLTNIEFSFGLR